jgi:rhodanese-related sulfurtransferase
MNSITPAQLAQWLQQVADPAQPDALPIVLDVREPWELQTASVKPEGFDLRHMPMRSVPARYPELDRHQPIACLCHHGARSQRVAAFLAQNGFAEVANVAGGIDAWSTQHDPSVPRY